MRVLDLFCGAAGGWSLGLHRAGFRTVAACEWDKWRRERFAANFPECRMYGDVRHVTAATLATDGVGTIDVVAGSPPCQDASTANTSGKGTGGARTGLVSEFVRLVREIRPRWALFENVPGIRTRGVDWVLAALAAAGYPSWPLVVGAWHAGGPHKRNRVWIIAADAHRFAEWRESRGRRGEDRTVPSVDLQPQILAADGDCYGELDAAINAEVAGTQESLFAAADADEEGREGGQLESSLREAAYTVDRRALFQAWEGWNGGFAGFGRMDDGLPAGMARYLSAYGDAVVPIIPELIGRIVMRAEGLSTPDKGEE